MTYKYKITVLVYDKEPPYKEDRPPMKRYAVLTTRILDFSNPIRKGDTVILTETPYFGISAENIIHRIDFSEIQEYKWRESESDPNSFDKTCKKYRSGLEDLSKGSLERDEVIPL